MAIYNFSGKFGPAMGGLKIIDCISSPMIFPGYFSAQLLSIIIQLISEHNRSVDDKLEEIQNQNLCITIYNIWYRLIVSIQKINVWKKNEYVIDYKS